MNNEWTHLQLHPYNTQASLLQCLSLRRPSHSETDTTVTKSTRNLERKSRNKSHTVEAQETKEMLNFL